MGVEVVSAVSIEASREFHVATDGLNADAIADEICEDNVTADRVGFKTASFEALRPHASADAACRQNAFVTRARKIDVAGNRPGQFQSRGSRRRDIAADAFHSHRALDVRHPDVSRDRLELHRSRGGNRHGVRNSNPYVARSISRLHADMAGAALPAAVD